MRKIILILIIISSKSYGLVGDSVSIYFIEKNVQLIDGCNKGVYPFNSQDTSKIKDLVLNREVEGVISKNQYPTAFTFIINKKKHILMC